MKKQDVVNLILQNKNQYLEIGKTAKAFAPSNIALCKYWGKRNQELNLPNTPSLSISLADKGTQTQMTLNKHSKDNIILDGNNLSLDSSFSKRLIEFLNLFRTKHSYHLDIEIENNIPVAAGLASSASGFASLVLTLDKLFEWGLTPQELSILARLGSGSACRSIHSGFVEWKLGMTENGMDCYAENINQPWNDLCIGLLILSRDRKQISSTEAMQRCMETSPNYEGWIGLVERHLLSIKVAIAKKDFETLGKTSEENAKAMHAIMRAANPAIDYSLPTTREAIEKIANLRKEGLSVYYTQDAGPNLKLLFLNHNRETIAKHFPTLEIIKPFF